MRALITGAAGFAGGWLVRACAEAGDDVFALSRHGTPDPQPGSPLPEDGVADGARVTALAVDLRDGDGVRAAVRRARPEVVYHLAALSSVGRSWEAPARTMGENVAAAANLLEAVRLEAPAARVVWVSSCEVYGSPAVLPVTESAPLAPANPYAVSKAGAELLTRVYADAYSLDIVCARPFSHSGPGQLPIFLLSSLARQAAEGRVAGVARLRVVTGNPDTRRDFTDVRDIVRAYRLLASTADAQGGAGDRGDGTPDPGAGGRDPGSGARVYNVSSGRSVSAAEQVALLAELLAPIEVEHVVDPARVRPHEVMDLRGDHSRLTAATGWQPQIPLRQTMADAIAYWERRLAQNR